MQTPNDAGAIKSLEELEAHIRESAHQTTALVMKTGARRGGRKMKAERRELMGMKLSVLSGENGRAVLPVRCAHPPSRCTHTIAVDFLTFFVASGRRQDPQAKGAWPAAKGPGGAEGPQSDHSLNEPCRLPAERCSRYM